MSFESLIHAVYLSRASKRRPPLLRKESMLNRYLRAAASRASCAAPGVPLESLTAHLVLRHDDARP
jgi:hypothetical protein